MCIRDSGDALQAHAEANEAGAHTGAGLLLLGQLAVRGAGAVSYTHLRAHETVLDLVCRLLLEKKKKTTEAYTIHYNLYNNTHETPVIP